MKRTRVVIIVLVSILVTTLLTYSLTSYTSRLKEGFDRVAILSFDGEQPLAVSGLREIIVGATNHQEALSLVATYYNEHQRRLALVFDEPNDTRLRGLVGMYITHLAAPYNTVQTAPVDLVEFASTPSAHCGTYALAQAWIYEALGLESRLIHVDGGWHGLLEVNVDGQWEVFDATVNVWISTSVEQILIGDRRIYRAFYTPVLDAESSNVYRAHLANPECDHCDTVALREGLPLWGITIFPSQAEVIS